MIGSKMKLQVFKLEIRFPGSQEDQRYYQNSGKGSWSDYLSHFNICSELNGWDEIEKVQYLSFSLRGQACQFLGTLPEESKRNYTRLVEALSRRFNSEGQSELYRVQLKNRFRLPNESLPELSQEIRRLVRLAYPEAPNNIIEILGKDYFVDAVNDGEIRWKIFQMKVKNLDEATAAAVEIESFKMAEMQRDGTKRFVREIRTDPDPHRTENSENSIQRQLDEILKILKNLMLRSPRTNMADVECYKCHERGHYARNCQTEI
jgi:hypothetical protein